ncbi:MAG: dihydrofolate reductase [Bacteroidales bacterium]|nr:dihydrofolate reductase [Bacteroidales bacterium]MBR5862461.1 dihydrofolate reductase [Bacteroidales bacterium]
MKFITKMITFAGMAAALISCSDKAAQKDFRYLVDEFADLKIMRYQVPGWDALTLQQKEYVYHLAEAAKYGRDIIWMQNCKDNLEVRKVLENILQNYTGDRTTEEFAQFETYAKRVFFSNGIHHHYAEDKFFPECSQEYFQSLMVAVGEEAKCEKLLPVMFDPAVYPARKDMHAEDIIAASAVNFYENVTRAEVEALYKAMTDPTDKTPVSYGLNSRVVKGEDGVVYEEVYKVGGLYGPALEKICAELALAAEVAENETQKEYIADLIAYYQSGDLKLWDDFNIKWVNDTLGTVDFVNGFVEDYNDPLGRKATYEGLVNFKDSEASRRAELISENAQWFEDNSPVDSRFKKEEVKGVTAKVINVATLAGDCYPAAPIGINLPNADWIRREHGSKSVTIANLTSAYTMAAQESPVSMLSEFAWDEAEMEMEKTYGALTNDLHTDLHECLGHGSGKLLPETSPNALGEFSSALEETRADLFGLYYLADPKLVELGILPDMEAYKAQYSSYIRNGIFTQFTRVALGKKNMEAHMQNRKLIADWCYEKGLADNVIEKKVRDGKTYFIVNDYEALRGLFGELLAEVQRIKSEGDYAAGKALVEKYAVDIDQDLHAEVLERYAALGLKPYGGFLNPEIVPVMKNGKAVDYKIEYQESYIDQMLQYGIKYSTL